MTAIRPKRTLPCRLLTPLRMIPLLLGLAVNVNAFEAFHKLDVELTPSRAHLAGTDRITVRDYTAPLKIYMGPGIVIDRLTVNGLETNYRRNGRWIALDPPASDKSNELILTLHYHGRFNDPAPVDPVNTDNPGYGVMATISPRGTLLLAGAGWYPSIAGAAERFRLEVAGPPGTVAVTAGRAVAAAPRPDMSVSAWQIDAPVERLALVAGKFKVRSQKAGHLQAMTYFVNDDETLANQYLQASLKYMAAYEELFGPYPFEKFAVVENFFPTGYGFPSYTLIGGRVLRLPFIIHTSLKHEIAHCWWGNGVLVDYEDGNWSEGLTTYVSDYRYRELNGAAAARDYRRQMLRNYTELVPPDADFPLTRFSGRHSTLTKAVGYDKAAMIFHMLRQRVGDQAFWSTLKRIAVERMFQRVSWGDIQKAFETACGCSLESFFRQWVRGTGAPQLSLAQIRHEATASGTRIRGLIHQRPPLFKFTVPIRLSNGSVVQTENIVVQGAQTAFEIQVPFTPERLEVDPEIDLFRRLAPEEMPPTINRLKSARDLLVVLPEGRAADPARAIATRLGRALGTENVEMVAASEWPPQKLRGHNILFMVAEGTTIPAVIGKGGLTIAEDHFTLEAATFDRRRHTYVGMYPHPAQSDGFVALYLFGQDEDRLRIATKVPHYGRYSYLIFEDSRNVAKGTWPITRSPLIHVWPQALEG